MMAEPMQRATMAVAGLMLAMCGGSAGAKEIRQHGAFSVTQEQTAKGIGCELAVTQSDDGKLFRLSMTQSPGRMFINLYTSTLDELRGQEASTRIDDREFMRFAAPKTMEAGLLFGIHVEANDDAMQDKLQNLSRDAHRFEVTAGDFHLSVPVDGLRQAVEDYVACRRDRGA